MILSWDEPLVHSLGFFFVKFSNPTKTTIFLAKHTQDSNDTACHYYIISISQDTDTRLEQCLDFISNSNQIKFILSYENSFLLWVLKVSIGGIFEWSLTSKILK